jgi:hypothetical protein
MSGRTEEGAELAPWQPEEALENRQPLRRGRLQPTRSTHRHARGSVIAGMHVAALC